MTAVPDIDAVIALWQGQGIRKAFCPGDGRDAI